MALAAITLTACFNPTYQEGRPCTGGEHCPGDLVCNPSTLTCLADVLTIDAAVPIDAVPVDAAIDAPPLPLPCVEGDRQGVDPATGNCYVVIEQNNTWANAQLLCENAGPGLHGASITSAAENAFIQSLVQGTDHWIGGNDIANENAFEWTSGELFSFTNWSGGEPNNSNNEDCIFYIGRMGGIWNDLPCGTADSALCERQL